VFDFDAIRKDGAWILIKSDDWFKVGSQDYRYFYGFAKTVEAKEIFGFVPKNGTNWYLVIGKKEPMVIAGCQIHHAMIPEHQPTDRADIYFCK